jgi:hypothetical protein
MTVAGENQWSLVKVGTSVEYIIFILSIVLGTSISLILGISQYFSVPDILFTDIIVYS